jgi:hypothetical protein
LTSSEHVGQHRYRKTKNQTAAHTDTDIELLSYITFNHFLNGAVNSIPISWLVNHKAGQLAPSV